MRETIHVVAPIITLFRQISCFWPRKLFSFISKNWLVHGDLHSTRIYKSLTLKNFSNIFPSENKYILLLSCNTSSFHFSAVSTLIGKFLFNIAQCWWVMRIDFLCWTIEIIPVGHEKNAQRVCLSLDTT